MIYADTSFLGSLYLQDANSKKAHEWFAANLQPILLSRLAELELSNACRLSVFRSWISETQCQQVFASIEHDLRNDVLVRRVFAVDEVFSLSESLSAQHTSSTGNRTLDVMHVACALQGEQATFATFDQRQAVLASACGLTVIPSADF